MTLKLNRAITKFQKAVNQCVTVSSVMEVVDGVIQDARRGTLAPATESITPFHTAQDIMDNKELVHDREFLEHMVAAATGRFLRMLLTDPIILQNIQNIRVMSVIESTKDVENKVIDKILLKYSN